MKLIQNCALRTTMIHALFYLTQNAKTVSGNYIRSDATFDDDYNNDDEEIKVRQVCTKINKRFTYYDLIYKYVFHIFL